MGDAIADVYRTFEYRKQCPDSPGTPVGVELGVDLRPGGAANVALNVAALTRDCKVDLIAVLDQDLARSIKSLSSNRVDMSHAVFVIDGPCLLKERIIIEGMEGSFVARLDNMTRITLSAERSLEWHLAQYLSENDPDLILLSDYACGAFTPGVLESLLPFRDRLLVDTKETDLSIFSGSLLAKLNAGEYARVLERDHSPERHFKFFVVTRGDAGARLIINRSVPGGSIVNSIDISARRVDAVDVCGCGDTFLAGLAAGLLRFDDPFEATTFANAAASTVVTQPRTAVADLRKTLESIGREHEACE